MGVDALLARARTRRQVLMRDTVTVTRVAGRVWNDSTGVYDETVTTVYSGPADVRNLAALTSQEVQVAERELVLRSFDVVLPWSVDAEFARGDLVTVDASADATFTGRVLTVRAVGHGGRLTGHHLDVEDRSA